MAYGSRYKLETWGTVNEKACKFRRHEWNMAATDSKLEMGDITSGGISTKGQREARVLKQ